MKTYKKILFGLIVAFASIALSQTMLHKVFAASPPQDNNMPDFYAACVVNVVHGTSNDLCTLNSKNEVKPQLLYDGLDDIETGQVQYQASTETNSVTINSGTVKFPSTLTLLNSSNQSLFSGNLAKDALSFGKLTFSKAYSTYDPASKYSFIDKNYAQIYGVYRSGSSSIFFLATNNPDGTTQVLAEVYNVPQPSSNTSAGTVFAAKINLTALKTDSSGTAIPSTSTDPNAPTQTTCEQNSGGWDFSWAVCPILAAASGLTNSLINLFEDQLSFTVGQLGSSTNPGSGASKVHQSWALIRDISTAMVVVVMLIMVFSQAISFGPFDAYTVRKLLPKLVAAVILIQISWVGVSWVIDLVNAVARGIADLMYYPFGGSKNMDLFSLLGNAGLGGTELGILNWAAVGVVIALGVAFLFTMLGIAFTAIIALMFALVTLVFRKILIIVLLIFAPLAILAWILPGTERYWKMWRDNLMKALFMFPIAVAIIAAGRVFAYITGTQDNSSVATAGSGSFLSLIFILVGFFGPLFILPKTFKWGGQAMQLAGNGIMKASSKVSERPKKFLDSRQEGWSAERTRRSQERFSKNEGIGFNRSLKKGFGVPSVWRRPIDLLKSGQMDPTLSGRRKQQAMDSYVSKGVASQTEDIKAASDRIRRVEEQLDEGATTDPTTGKALNKDDFWQDVAMGVNRRYQTYDGREIWTGEIKNPTEKRAAMDRMAVLQGSTNLRAIEQMYEAAMSSGDAQRQSEMRNFLNDNVQTLLPKMGHLYKGVMSMADSSPDGIAEMHGVEVEAILAGLSNRIADTTRPVADRKAAQRSLNTFLTSYQAAIKNPNLRARLELGGTRAVKGFLSADRVAGDYQLRRINMDARDGRARRTFVDGAGVTRSMPTLMDARTSPDVIGAIDPTLILDLDAEIADDGGFR